MHDATTEPLTIPAAPTAAPTGSPLGAIGAAADALTEVLRQGARSLLITAIEAEVTDWIDQRVNLVDLKGRRQVVRNGHADPRTIVTCVGPLSVQMPRVHDRRPPEAKERFTSALLPPYLRKAKAMDELIPYLYLLGVSTGDFTEALRALVGSWLLGGDAEGLAGDWEQRCTVHKTANVLDKTPKHLQPDAKTKLHQIWMADTRKEAEKAFDVFIETYEAKHEGAVACLKKDREALLTFYDFPAQHWRHIRTSNPIESAFATVRLRHDKTKGNGSKKACLAMVFKLAQTAQRGWRKLNGHELISDVIQGVKFVDGDRIKAA